MNDIDAIHLDFSSRTVDIERSGTRERLSFEDPETFAVLSEAWLLLGWYTKYVYTFSWMGRPVIQLPEDLVRVQEAIYSIRPDVIVETGVAHGGSLVFYASLCKAMGNGKVIGIDVEIRPHNRSAIEAHELFDLITLVEGDSVSATVLSEVRSLIGETEKTMVILDSSHTKDHVLKELRTYSPLVSPGSYLVAADGIMAQVAGAPRTDPDWGWNNPREAVREFLEEQPEFVLEPPPLIFDEGNISRTPTYWIDGWLKRVKGPARAS